MTVDGCGDNPQKPYPGDCAFTAFLREKARDRSDGAHPAKESEQEVVKKIQGIRLLLLDVDGVLTDGTITYSDRGEEIKSFHARDGFGINILRKSGVEVGIITARTSKALKRRIQDLSLTHVYQGVRNKVQAFQKILDTLCIQPQEVAYMGDDWLDLSIMRRVGFAAAVADATPEVLALAHFVSRNPGGKGAVRELCDLIIETQGKRTLLLNEYMNRL